MITYRRTDLSEKRRVAEIDRSEHVIQDYIFKNRELVLLDVEWHIPRWSTEGSGPHSVDGKLNKWEMYFRDDCVLWGAFDGETLVGFSAYRPGLTEDMGQLTLLHVSKEYRRLGIGRRLAENVVQWARQQGDRRLYVSATQSRPTVDFYTGLGFTPTDQPVPELFEMEPEDIHMVMDLTAPNHPLQRTDAAEL